MIIAVAYENGEVSQHYGQCKSFKIYEVSEGAVIDSAVVTAIDNGHEELAAYLLDYNTDALICGGIGDGARSPLDDAGIQVYTGVTGSADKSIEDFLSGALKYDPAAKCSHNHEDGHACCCGHDSENGHGCCCGHSHEDGHGCGC